ncbi:MAG TPA: flagellar basal body P-ring protein FlgI [Spirochaetota bacterium]|nr:flagellar basal body P-ring protein FlgI [Spirochaetota bacterium]
MNAIGATTADIIAILKALEASGALHAELIVR